MLGPSVNVIVWSNSNTPESGETSVNAKVLFPGVEMTFSLEPLSTLITTLLSSVDVKDAASNHQQFHLNLMLMCYSLGQIL